MKKEVILEIEKSGIGKVDKDVSLAKLTTYKVGGIARVVVYPKNTSCLVKLIKIIRRYNLEYKILGNGSNLLCSDKDYEGVLIRLNEFDNLEFLSGNKIKVGAGFSLMKLSAICAKRSLTGLEFASGIPGTVGGAVFMNAGAYKSDMGYIVVSVKILTDDLRIITLENKEMDFHYRTSFLQKHRNNICLEVVIKLEKGKRDAIEEVIRERRKRRREAQPLEYPSAGSVFRNPEGMFAGQMIEELGLKGLKKGGAMISEKHANFIINKGGASASDVKYLIEYVKKRVKEEYNVDLKVEQEFMNWE